MSNGMGYIDWFNANPQGPLRGLAAAYLNVTTQRSEVWRDAGFTMAALALRTDNSLPRQALPPQKLARDQRLARLPQVWQWAPMPRLALKLGRPRCRYRESTRSRIRARV